MISSIFAQHSTLAQQPVSAQHGVNRQENELDNNIPGSINERSWARAGRNARGRERPRGSRARLESSRRSVAPWDQPPDWIIPSITTDQSQASESRLEVPDVATNQSQASVLRLQTRKRTQAALPQRENITDGSGGPKKKKS